MEQVRIFDTTLRDGEQAPGFSMDLDQKVRMAKALLELKVDVIEAGFPVASPGDFAAVKAIATEASDMHDTFICGLARANEKDIQAVADSIAPAAKKRIHTFIATSPIHREHKLRMSKEQVLEKTIASVRQAKDLADEVEFSAEDAIRTERDYLVQVFGAAIEAGATTINVPDTVGYTTPQEIEDLFRYLIANTPGAEKAVFSAHCHDDLGMAVANSLAAVRGGARQVECALNGIGERAGNCALEEVVMAINTRADFFELSTQIDTTKLYNASRLLARLTGQDVPRNKAIVGDNAFAHESGIHQDGMLKNLQTYEIMRPSDVGAPTSLLVLGKHSGRNALADRARELGHNLSGERLNEVFEAFKQLADSKKNVTNDDLKSLILGQSLNASGPWRVAGLKTGAERDGHATAHVTLTHQNGTVHTHEARGNGPLDAAFSSIKEIVGLDVHLEDFSVKSIGTGIDAQGWADVHLLDNSSENEMVVGGEESVDRRPRIHGSGVHTDIVFASVIAYLDAMNRIVRNRAQQS
ncbi:2-isopropylmalate synthase [Parvularcula flava]|uniref:2-isopropylmalate synthase n=1 Tax=Aquisalinus luteolus TaxID=1566827 RepID=A0A8J3A7A7_9PROT|nr:2-isopropylmalate synthase [Aquisalinus luteolus]NHK27651.1 2-isopropylmalate synthase [Aquisalinus luteolus]GGH96086.1 2-isopropylmalate synthase [Aquisalinus luteolus]